MRMLILGLQYYKNCSKFSNIESKYCPEKFLCSCPLGQAGRLDYQTLNESYNITKSRDCGHCRRSFSTWGQKIDGVVLSMENQCHLFFVPTY